MATTKSAACRSCGEVGRDNEHMKLCDSCWEVESRIGMTPKDVDDALKALKGFVVVVAADGHGFHHGTELGRALGAGQRLLRRLGRL